MRPLCLLYPIKAPLKSLMRLVPTLRKYAVASALNERYIEPIEHNVLDKIESKPTKEVVVTKEKIPLIRCRRKEFNFYAGKTFAKFDPMRIASQGWQSYKSKGDYFTIYPIIEEEDLKENDYEFRDLNIKPSLIENLKKANITSPTTVQKLAIPEIFERHNVAIISETGCGKTLAFLLPIIQNILEFKPTITDRPSNSPLAVIITPSRELTMQISAVAKQLSANLDISIKTLLSGNTKKVIQNPSIQSVDILISTLGIINKLAGLKIYRFDYVCHTVIDEAHALFDESFNHEMENVLRKINFGFRQSTPSQTNPHCSQMTLVSATMPQALPEYVNTYIDTSTLVNVTTRNFHRILVPQKFLRIGPLQKPAELLRLTKPRAAKKEPTLIFSNSASTSDWISIFLNQMNIKTVSLNGKMAETIRRNKYSKFRNGEVSILSTTNAGARGLDTTMVDFIINYEFPMNTADYIHRCGRTGRIGGVSNGRILNFISQMPEIELVQKLERSARRGHAVPIFDAIQQKENKIMDAELKKLLTSAS